MCLEVGPFSSLIKNKNKNFYFENSKLTVFLKVDCVLILWERYLTFQPWKPFYMQYSSSQLSN